MDSPVDVDLQPGLAMVAAVADELVLAIATVVRRVEDEHAAHQEERAKWEGSLNLQPPNLQGRVQLDVGGVRFFTTKATLSSKSGFFRALCQGLAPVELDQDKCVFIDRDAEAFRHVLLHLQNQSLDLGSLTPSELEALKLDAAFYELDELARALGTPLGSAVCERCAHRLGPGAASCANCDEPTAAARKRARLDCEPQRGACTDSSALHRQLRIVEDAVAGADRRLAAARAEFADERDSLAGLQKKLEETVSSEKIKLQLMTTRIQFCTTVGTLCSKPGSFFAAKFGTRERWQGDMDASDGSVFIERDDYAFRHVLNHLRGYPTPACLSEKERNALRADKDYYLLGDWELSVFPSDSAILAPTDVLARQLCAWLPNKTLTLLYRASRDGFSAAEFHKLCDVAPQTVTICKNAAGLVFGGFASVPWRAQAGVVSAPDSFLFSGCAGGPHKFACQDSRMALLCNAAYGPLFGEDLQVVLDRRLFGSHFPRNYLNPSGVVSPFGLSDASLAEVEIYKFQ